jgi:ribosomal-protein-alanine N-acetyltransferase
LIGLWHFFDERQPQLLYALLPDFTGRGYAAEGARRIVEYAFAELGLDYLDASCDVPNAASQRTAERLGMKKYKEEVKNGLPTLFYRLEKR